MAPAPGNKSTEMMAMEDTPGPIKKAPKKIYIPIRIQTNALNKDDIAINATYISIEDLPLAMKKKKRRDIEIRYMDSIRNIRDKFKSSYSCNQNQCPMIKERLDQHQMHHHQSAHHKLDHQVVRNLIDDHKELSHLDRCCSRGRHSQAKFQSNEPIEVSKGTVHRLMSTEPRVKKSVAITTTASILKRSSNPRFTESVETTPKFVDFNHTTQNSFESNRFRSDERNQDNYDDETVTPKSSILRDDLQEEIQKWFEDIPIYPNLTASLKNLRRNMVNEFIDKIFEISSDVKTDNERRIRTEVENFLNALPMWYPGAKRDQELLKDGITNNLLEKIRSLREKSNEKQCYDTVNTDAEVSLNEESNINQTNSNNKEKIVESEVLEWLMQIKFKESEDIGKTINIIDATDVFTKRLTPLLEKSTCTKNYKLVLKGLIVDTLNDLPNVLHYPKNKRIYLNRIAEDLANRLISAQMNYKRSFTCCFPKQKSMYQMAVCSKSSLKQSILDGLNDRLQSSSLDNGNDIKEEITDILIDCLESVRLKDMEEKDELINDVLGHSVEISNTQTSDITIENVREILTGDLIKNGKCNDMVRDKSCHSGNISIFTSEHELPCKYPITSTPKQKAPIRQETQKLNKEEINYIEKVGLLIRNWMETLPTKFEGEENKNFKEVMINDLAGDIMDQLKIELLAPNTNANRDQFMFYIVFRWLFRFEVYEDLNEATPQVNDLVQRLHEIPVPNLTMPQKGNRQAMANVNHMEEGRGWKEEFIPQGVNVLQDEISIWMHEQPEEIYSKSDKDYQNKMVQELAETVKNRIGDKIQEQELEKDISKWLKLMLKSSDKNNIKVLAQSLKNRINKLRQDDTLVDNVEGKIKNKRSVTVASSNSSTCCPVEQQEVKTSESETSQESKTGVTCLDKTNIKCGDTKTSGSNTSQDAKLSVKGKRKEKTASTICKCSSDIRKKKKDNVKSKHVQISESDTSQDSKHSRKGNKNKSVNATSQSSICGCHESPKVSKTSKTKKSEEKKQAKTNHSQVSSSKRRNDRKSVNATSQSSICGCHESPKVSKTSKNKKSEEKKQAKTNHSQVSSSKRRNDRKSKTHIKKLSDKKTSSKSLTHCECSKIKNATKSIDSDTSGESNLSTKGTVELKQTTSQEKPIQSSESQSSQGSVSGREDSIKESKPTCHRSACPMKSDNGNYTPDKDRALLEFISKYMERNDVDDSIAKGAFEEILKTEFRKLAPSTRKEVYDNYAQGNHDEFSPDRLDKELQLIKDISDWLKNIPMDISFNTPQNKERIEFVNDLAKNIYEVEEKRHSEPGTVGYNTELTSIIRQFTEKLPILPNCTESINFMVDQLVKKVIAGRTPMPCCMDTTATSLNSSGIPEQNISEFIENYIRLNAGEIAHDPVKLDAWSARVLKEAKKIIRDSAEPSTQCKTEVYNKLGNVPIPEEESIRLFGLELDYAKEISDWLNNLPLLPITSPDGSEQRVKMISELAEKFADREKIKIINPEDNQSEDEMKEYVTNWVNAIPLDPNKEMLMPLVIKQLLNRIKRVNMGPPESSKIKSSKKSSSKTKLKPKCSKTNKTTCNSGAKAGQLVVDTVENWSNNLPIKIKCKNAEKSIKESVARNLFQKVGDLSVDAQVMKDDLLFKELLADEVNKTLDSLPQSPDIVKKKETLMNSLIDKVMEAKSIAKESAAGENYKQELEKTIVSSIPNPIFTRQTHDPGFEIYKNRLTEMFILENFDHGTDEAKLKYEKRIKKEIDKHFQDAQKRNALPLTKEQIYSELYGALFKVPMPGESSTIEEVEEVKTRCEIADWFESLPLQEASGDEELLDRDKIQSMLAKRLKEIERNTQKPDEKIHKEITKWLNKLPLNCDATNNEQKINELANDLLNKFKTTKEDRKCVMIGSSDKDKKKSKSFSKKPSKTKGILGTSQVAGPSSSGQTWASQSSPACCQVISTPRKKAADIILEIVQNWCESLPFYENSERSISINRQIREDLGTKIIIKLCELNGDPKLFSDELLYDYLLDDELEKLMSNLPICCDFEPTKDYKKSQLKERINSVKPLIKEERARHEYKKELNETVNIMLKEPLNTTADKMALFNELREEIVDNFVQYHYHRDDDEGKQIYKATLRDAVMKYFLEVQEQSDDPPVDSLIKQNQLICELAKIPIPNERLIKDEVEEIRMKGEVKQFFEEQSITDEYEDKKTAINNIQHSLSKRLNDIEKSGHNCTNDAIMKKEISRYLKKIEKDISNDIIGSFVDNLKANEATRKALPIRKNDDIFPHPTDSNNTGFGPEECDCRRFSQTKGQEADVKLPKNSSLALRDPTHTQPLPISNLCCPQAYEAKSLGTTAVEYQGFGRGIALNSSPRPSGPNGQSQPTSNTDTNNRGEQEPTNQEGFGKFQDERRQKKSSGEGKEECKCAGRTRQKMRGRPRCVLRDPEFYDNCETHGPMWMPMPPYRYPPGYFYY